jgi:hypothetical protein
MADYLHLPIFIKTYEFNKYIYRIIRQFPREYKYTLGKELQQIMWQILDEIMRTNSLPDEEKKKGLNKISELFDMFKVRFRLAYEIGALSKPKFCIAQKQIEEIGKMIGGWQRWIK